MDSVLLLLRELHGAPRGRAVSMLDGVLPASERVGLALAQEVRVFVVVDVACHRDRTLACALVSARGAEEMELHALVVDPARRRLGVGRYLVLALADRCRSDGTRRIVTTVRSVAVGRLLTRCGFTVSPTGDRAADDPVRLRLDL
jgi:GNAT superfamily N-acetyltransferase